MKIYLIAKKLSHSFSPQIHKRLADYSYELCELEENSLSDFFRRREFDGLNVTIPYKTEVMKYLDEISPEAEKIGAVNTVVNCGGKLIGYNTDYFGFMHTVIKSGVNAKGKRAVVIGNGGASKTAVRVLSALGAESVRVLTRAENIDGKREKYYDAQIIVNATPVGMYPDTCVSPVELDFFKECEAVFDLIYNPSMTKLLLDAKRLGMTYSNGLLMLVSQAKAACEYFTGRKLSDDVIDVIKNELEKSTKNIVLVGMPGCGKSVTGKSLAKILGREFFDCDDAVSSLGRTPAEIISESGEGAFRKIETECLKELCKKSGSVIATGGGAVTVEENYNIIRQNATVVFINRKTEELSVEGRPLSKGEGGVFALFEKRLPLYRKFSDFEVNALETPEKTARLIIEKGALI